MQRLDQDLDHKSTSVNAIIRNRSILRKIFSLLSLLIKFFAHRVTDESQQQALKEHNPQHFILYIYLCPVA